MNIRAKFQCSSVENYGSQEKVNFHAVYSPDPEDPNYTWSKASPQGSFSITISNPAARGKFEPGKSYFLDITPA